MADQPNYSHLAALAGLPDDNPLVRLAATEHAALMQKLGGQASEREMWLVALCVQRAVELAANLASQR